MKKSFVLDYSTGLYLILGVAIVFSGFFILHLSMQTADVVAHDDAYISYVYARNFAAGSGLTFNPGERVWGFTSPLNTLLLGTFGLFSFDIPTTSWVLTVLEKAGSAVLIFLIAARLNCSALVCLLLGLYALFISWPIRHIGLEGHLLVLLQLAFLYCGVIGRASLAVVLAALSCLARPDSVLLVLPVMLMNKDMRRVRNLAIFAGIGLAWELFALCYYEELLPNTFYAKVGEKSRSFSYFIHVLSRFADIDTLLGISTDKLFSLAGTTADIVSWIFQLVVVCALSSLLFFSNMFSRHRELVYVLFLYPWVFLVAYSFIAPPLGHVWEMQSALYFFRIGVVAGACIFIKGRWSQIVGSRSSQTLERAYLVLALLALFSFALVNTNAFYRSPQWRSETFYNGLRHKKYEEIGRWISANLPAQTPITSIEVGTLGYYSNAYYSDHPGIISKKTLSLFGNDMRRPPSGLQQYLLVSGFRRQPLPEYKRWKEVGKIWKKEREFEGDGFYDIGLYREVK